MHAAEGRWWLPGILPLLLVLAVAAAWANALGASFQFDDWDVIVRDPRVQSLGAWWESMPGIRPLLKLSYALNHASGLGVMGFHAVNVVIHALNALAVLWLFRQRLAAVAAREIDQVQDQNQDLPAPALLAFLGALVFALHPVQTEAVTYVSGRSVSLATGLGLASLMAWVAGRERARPWLALGLSPLLMAAAMATRETLVILPLVLLAWAATEPERQFRWRAFLRDSGPHWGLALAGAVLVLAWPRYRDLVAMGLGLRTPLENLAVQADALRYLAGQLVLPGRLNADPVLAGAGNFGIPAVLTVLLLLAAVGAAVLRRNRWPVAAFAVFWFLAWLLPTNSVLARLDVVNDRQLYGALAGPALLLAAMAGRLLVRLRSRGVPYLARGGATAVALLSLAAVVAVTLGLATHQRNRVYATELSFWGDVVAKSPGSSRAHNNLGMALAAECRLMEARAQWVTAFRLDPANIRAAVNVRLLDQGQLPEGLGPCP